MDLKQMSAEELHAFVESYNWDDGGEAMLEVTKCPNCDLGTALMIYWLACPTYWFVEYAERSEVPEEYWSEFDFLIDIEQRVTNGFYKTHQFEFDPTQIEASELDAEEEYQRPIPREMFGPLYNGRVRQPAEQEVTVEEIDGMDAQELHDFAEAYMWMDGVEVLNAVINNPQCDTGTALMVYWHMDPHAFDEYDDADALPDDENEAQLFVLLKDIEKRVLANTFKTRRIAFDPADDEGSDWTCDDYADGPKKRHIPKGMFEPITVQAE